LKRLNLVVAGACAVLVMIGCSSVQTRMTLKGLETNQDIGFQRWGFDTSEADLLREAIVGEWCLVGRGLFSGELGSFRIDLFEFLGLSDCDVRRHVFTRDGIYRRLVGRLGAGEEWAESYSIEGTSVAAPGFNGQILDVAKGYMFVMLNPETESVGVIHVFGKVGPG